MNKETTINQIHSIIHKYKFHFSNEKELQDHVNQQLKLSDFLKKKPSPGPNKAPLPMAG